MKKTVKKLISLSLIVLLLIPTVLLMASAAPANTFLWPVPSSYSMSRGFSSSGHKAIDVTRCEGKDIVASYDGVVYSYVNKCQHYSKSCTSCDSTGMGVGLILKHTINGTTYYTYYAHMQYNSVPSAYRTKNATVKQGDVIGKVGSSGNSTGPHLHFTITQGATWSNYINNNPTDTSKHSITSSNGVSYKYSMSYTLTYNVNGGSGAPATQTGATSYTISSVLPSRFGWTFEGWALNSNATYSQYSPGSSISLAYNTTLYAVWANNFDSSESNLISSTDNIQFTNQERYYKFIPQSSGYHLIEANAISDIDLKSYLYDSAGNQLAYNDDRGSDYPGTSIKSRDTRIIQYLTAGNTYYIKAAAWSGKTGAFYIYACKIPELRFNANGGLNAPATQMSTSWLLTNKNYTIPSTYPTRANYTFLGWSTNSNATSASYQPGSSIEINYYNDGLTLYAVWQQNHTHNYVLTDSCAATCTTNGYKEYTCSCDDKYTTVTQHALGHNFSDYDIESAHPHYSIYRCSRNGCSEISRTPETNYDSSCSQCNPAPAKATNVTVTAGKSNTATEIKWSAREVAASDINDTDYFNVKIYRNESGSYSLYSTEKVNYSLSKLNPSVSIVLPAGSYYAEIVTVCGENKSLTSCTDKYYFTVEAPIATYTLSYNANGGSGAPSSQSGSTTYTISSTRPTRSGYTFLGWSKSSSSYATANYSAGDTITLTSNTTLYAVWRANSSSNNNIKITIRNNPGTVNLNYGDTIRLYADAENLPSGARIGWYVDDGSSITAETSADNTYCEITAKGNGTVTIAAKAVDANGNIITDSQGNQIGDVQKINTKSSFWLKIVSFFKNLFRANRTTVQALKNVF